MTEAEDQQRRREEVRIMIFSTLMMFASVAGCVAIFILEWLRVSEAGLTGAVAFLLPLLFLVGLWNVYDAMVLVARPTWRGAWVTVARALAAFGPLILVLWW